MNTTQNPNQQRIRISEETAYVRRPQKRGPDEGALRVLRGAMLICGAVILVLGLLLVIFPMFKVQNIVVEGNNYCDEQAIIAASGIVNGNELIGLDLESAMYAIFANCPNGETCSSSISFPFTVKIRITEQEGVMYAAFQDKYFSFNRDLRVLEIKSNGEEQFSPFLHVKLPAVAAVYPGRTIQFVNSGAELSYLTSLLDTLSRKNLLKDVTYIDFSERFSLSYVLNDTCRVEIGKLADIDLKLTCAEEILKQKGGIAAGYAVIDVSNTDKSTYQKITADQLFE